MERICKNCRYWVKNVAYTQGLSEHHEKILEALPANTPTRTEQQRMVNILKSFGTGSCHLFPPTSGGTVTDAQFVQSPGNTWCGQWAEIVE